MKTFNESERICQASFLNAGPFWFASSPGKDTPMLFTSNDDFTFVMNVIAQIAYLFPNLKIVAFVVMNNHFHFVIQCDNEWEIRAFFSAVKKRLQRLFPQIKSLELDIRPITDLNSLRNRIAYTHRNGYVAHPECTPFNYRWGTGRYYFNDYPVQDSLGAITVRQKRTMFKGRDPQLPDGWNIVEGHIDPRSYCPVRFGTALFRDAHHYMSLLTKNMEAWADLAGELGDKEFLTDPEIFAQLRKIIQEQYGVASSKELTKLQRLDLARALRYDFHSSNGQIRRVLGLTRYEVDSLFPLGKK
ncbi:MAG: hypothetical protein Q4F39_07255 [Bacteroidia bacterium]|nr:hypothetical protein [Bacteroidia bacterium]